MGHWGFFLLLIILTPKLRMPNSSWRGPYFLGKLKKKGGGEIMRTSHSEIRAGEEKIWGKDEQGHLSLF